MSESSARVQRWKLAVAGSVLTLVAGAGICEAMGWPFLVGPVQRWLGATLDRQLRFGADPAAPVVASIHLLGGVTILANYIEIGAPAWSHAPYTLLGRDARMTLGYLDLLRAKFGGPLPISELRATRLDGHLERLSDGRASWQFGKPAGIASTASSQAQLPQFGQLQIDSGVMAYSDAMTELTIESTFSLIDQGSSRVTGVNPAGASPGLRFSGSGSYRKQPLQVDVQASSMQSFIGNAARAAPITLSAHIGKAALSFQGTATDALHLSDLKGRFSVQGPSLAAVGDPLRVTLPTTGPFRAEGLVTRQGLVWSALVQSVDIGSSRLAGAFTYDMRASPPNLAGRLTGAKLLLADLGPAVGAATSNPVVAATPSSSASSAAVSASRSSNAAPGRVIPNREFDLPALREMQANVLVDVDDLDLGSSFLEPLKPLRTHLVLTGSVLTMHDLEGHTGQGRLLGVVQLDGRNSQAQWNADLRWDGVRLESWIHQSRAGNAAPYATGVLSGQARLAGQGKSSAEILGSLHGDVRMNLANGTISHLAVEAAGMNVVQGLGVIIKGDDALPILCTVVDLVADRGVLRPRALVLETPDSTLWLDGSLSLATESMDMRVVVTPKDFSPLALRTPVHLRGTFAKPSFSVDAGRLGARVGASALLALVNPLAALIPFVDVGSGDDAKRGADACKALSQRMAAANSAAKPR